jgi:hypothetical protein
MDFTELYMARVAREFRRVKTMNNYRPMKIAKMLAQILLIASLALLSSCATFGTAFNLQESDKLQLGKTQTSDAVSLFGKPYSTDKKSNADGNYEIFAYNYAQNSFGTIGIKLMALEFKEGKLNGYFFTSSFKSDKTQFDLKITDSLKAGIGHLTQEDVLAAIGKPNGKVMCPTTLSDFKKRCAKGTETWAWLMNEASGKSIKTISLYVSFDASGKISGVDTEEIDDPL